MKDPSRNGRLHLQAGRAEAQVVPGSGGRIGSLRVDGLETLVTEGWGPLSWGAYPMVPWAGRLDRGVLAWGGERHRFPTDLAPPHAIHGTLLEPPWEVVSASSDAVELAAELAEPWPFGGSVRHRIGLFDDRLEATLEVRAADRRFPAIVGWHPWFVRSLRDAAGTTRGGRAEVDLPAGAMLRRGPDMLPDGALVRPIPPGPWDDCFTELTAMPSVTWPGALRIEVDSGAAYVVVYTQDSSGVCIEPETGPPNGINTGMATLVEPGGSLVASMTLRWGRPG